jgi:hypothetical protein
MTDHNLPSELLPANVLRSFKPPSSKEMDAVMVMVRVATRAVKLSDKLPDKDLSEYVSGDEAAAIMNELGGAIDTLELLTIVCAAGYEVLDKALPV